jgi:integrase
VSVYKRGSRWAARIDLEPTALGGRRRKSLGSFATRKDGERAERQAIEARDRGSNLDPRRVTLADVAERFLTSVAHELSPSTTARYDEHWRMHVAPTVGGIPVAKLKPAHLTALYAKLRTEPITYRQRSRAKATSGMDRERVGKALSANTVLRVHRFLHRLLDWAEGEELVGRNVARMVKKGDKPKGAPSPARALSSEQVAAVLAASEGSRYHTFFVFAAMTSMRRGEIGALAWDSIDFERGVAAVRQAIGEDRRGGRFLKGTKTGRERVVPLAPRALVALRRQRAMQHQDRLAAGGLVADGGLYVESGFVFTNELGRMLDLDAVSKAFSAAATKAGVKAKGYSLHSLRHFGATQALVSGADVRTVAALLGHASASTTLNVYSHVVAGAQERAVASIGEAIAEAQARRQTAEK